MKNYSFPLVVYDEKCELCRRFRLSIERFLPEEKIYFENLHNPELYESLSVLKKEECEKEVHLLISENEVLRGAEALQYLVGKFPLVKKFSWLIESNMGHKALETFYQICNKYRESYLNDCDSCHKKRHRQ